MSSSIQTFLDQALPHDSGAHILAIGEDHRDKSHISWLKLHLQRLKNRHNVATIGIELPTYYNVFLWAYQDGTLTRHFGSQAAARDYMIQVIGAITDFVSLKDTTELLLDAMDSGIRVVAYDSRFTMDALKSSAIANASEKDAPFLTEFAKGENAPDRRDLAYNHDHQSRLADNAQYKTLWQLGEVAWLLKQQQSYCSLFDKISRLQQLGLSKIRKYKLSSDGLSAVLFHVLKTTDGNCITIGGLGHVSGIYLPQATPINSIHGSFGHHLFTVGAHLEPQRQHKVTASVIATTARLRNCEVALSDMLKISPRPVIAGEPIAAIDIAAGLDQPIKSIALPAHSELPITEVFQLNLSTGQQLKDLWYSRNGKTISDEECLMRLSAAEKHVDPLLMPDIKAAADAVRMAMNGQEHGRPR